MKKIVWGLVVVVASIVMLSCASAMTKIEESKENTNLVGIEKNATEIMVRLPKVLALTSSKKELISPIIDIDTTSGFVFWDCKDYVYSKETLFQIGYFTFEEETTGFVILDQPFLEEKLWTPGTPMPGEINSIDELPKGKILTPFGIASTAEVAVFSREGLNYIWDWGDIENNEHYTIVMSPNGTIRYYDFTNVPAGESAKPSGIYKAYKR